MQRRRSLYYAVVNKIKWDSQQNLFVFQNGRHLSLADKKIYRRQIWKLTGLGFEDAELVLERQNDSWVDVMVSYSEESGAALRPATLFLFDSKDAGSPLQTFLFTNTVGMGSSTEESRTIGLPEDSEVTAKTGDTGLSNKLESGFETLAKSKAE